jgi:hypothetical protein
MVRGGEGEGEGKESGGSTGEGEENRRGEGRERGGLVCAEVVAITDIFKIDYTCVSFDDILRLNNGKRRGGRGEQERGGETGEGRRERGGEAGMCRSCSHHRHLQD